MTSLEVNFSLMKAIKLIALCVSVALVILPGITSGQKFLKNLTKADSYYEAGNYAKAQKSLAKFKSSIEKLGAANTYMPTYYIREARINLALGTIAGFDVSLANALTTSLTSFGENSTSYALTQLDVADIYNQYGNYRLSLDYIHKATALLEKTSQMTHALKARIALEEAEALTGQGFCNSALQILRNEDKYFASRAVEKETIVEQGALKTKRVPEEEIYQRFGDYAKFLILVANAYGKEGDIDSADYAFLQAQTWIRKNQRFMGENSVVLAKNNYLYAKMLLLKTC